MPAVGLRISADDAASRGDGGAALATEAIAAGCNVIILEQDGSGDAGALYEAAVALAGACRGRAALLVADRPDIASAAGADGVALSEGGLPIAVARRGLELGASAEARTTPVVACLAGSVDAAQREAKAGADLLLLVGDAASRESVEEARARVSVPLLVASESAGSDSAGAEGVVLSAVIAEGAEGGVRGAMASIVASLEGTEVEVAEVENTVPAEIVEEPRAAAADVATPAEDVVLSTLNGVLGDEGDALLADERAMLAELSDFFYATTPQLEELPLLPDAIKALDELFLLVIVGEFNSGKSSLMNALLGGEYLPTGNLPTTNEISVLRYGEEKTERDSDGQFVRYVPSPLLREIQLVDTPGTNVVLERQQKLTEEYVPRADLVLFVLSADRPLSGSEVNFLKYIRKWGKKVIFAVNKYVRSGRERVRLLSGHTDLSLRSKADPNFSSSTGTVAPPPFPRALLP